MVDNSSKCIFVLISMLGRVKNNSILLVQLGPGRLKSGSVSFFFPAVSQIETLVANRQSWDVDWLQIGTLETLIGSHVCNVQATAPRSEMCVSGLYHLFSVPLILLTNTYTSCGWTTLNFVERFWFWLGSVRSASKIQFVTSTSPPGHTAGIWHPPLPREWGIWL